MRESNLSIPLAAATSGPFFMIVLAASTLYLELPRPILIEAGSAFGFVLAIPVSAGVSALVATLPCLLATKLLAAAGRAWPPARDTAAWLLVGAGLGSLLAAALPAEEFGGASFAWIATSIWAAWMCRRGVEWD